MFHVRTMRALFLALVGLLVVQQSLAAMTEKQLAATLKLLRNTCQPKTKATNEQIEAMHKGDWNQDKNGQCYMNCILSMNKLITKENTFDVEAAVAMITNQAPESIRGAALISIENCKDAVKTPDDKCAPAFEVARCMYFDNPEKYFLP